MTNNAKVRSAIADSKLKMYEIAHEVGISAGTLSVWLRYELPEDKQKAIFLAISTLKGER